MSLKLTTMKLKYKIKEVKPNVFAVIIKEQYDRAMLFCRGQEYYESTNKKFRGKDFSIWDYMKWYSAEYGKGFSYGTDWSGFNIPFDILWKCYQTCEAIGDWETPYDGYMWEILVQIDNIRDQNKKAYIIGAANTNDDTFQHEICHGLYYTNKQYKELVDEITISIPIKDYMTFRNNLTKMGYTNKVMNDEIQAYLAFGHDYKSFSKGVDSKVCKELHKQYINVFNNF